MRISILLPYKENFSPNYAGAVSLFVNDTTKESIFNTSTYIFGNTESKIKLSKNYINLDLDKKIFRSTSKQYINTFTEYQKKIDSDLIEVHNRPNYIKQIKQSFKKKNYIIFS